MGRLISPAGIWLLGSLLLVTPQPGALWYKHSASPRYHTVGRASGLLIGVRRSPYLWRREVPAAQQRAGEKAGLTYEQWKGAEIDHQLYPDPGDKSTLMGKLYRDLEEDRSLDDGRETSQDVEKLEEAGWRFKELGDENRQIEMQNWLPGNQDLVGRSLGENKLMVMEPAEEEEPELTSAVKETALVKKSLKGNSLLVMEPREEKRMLEETWLSNSPGEPARSLEGERWMFTEPMHETRSLDREMRGQLESKGDKAPNSEDILSMYLKKYQQGDGKAFPQPWERHLPRDKKVQDFRMDYL